MVGVQVVKALRQVASKLLDGFLGKLLVLLDELEKISSRAVLEDDPKVVAGFVPIVELEDVAVLQGVEHADFVVDLFPPVLLDGLDGHVVDRLLFSALELAFSLTL